MTLPAILAPVFVQVALTFALLVWTGRSRVAAVRSKEVRVGEVVLGQRAWPTRVQQVSNAYQNQLEIPVLFHVLVILAILTRKTDLLFVVLSWAFVASRLVHAFIHTTSNRLLWRFQAFLVGVGILALMWTIFAVRVLFGAAA
ncbi:MAG TPA: MAPEG family protein [Microvirga sp.]|jgi:hypothetical protein|nr:MAPEG family protein [Microvirga sp.]